MDIEKMEIAKQEWDSWRLLSATLVQLGAVTTQDANSRVSELNTDGQKLYALIKKWGKDYARLIQVSPEALQNE